MAGLPTQAEIGAALARLGHYRVQRAQVYAKQGLPDDISGSLVLALGLRETWGRNIEGGARWDANLQKWVALDPGNPAEAALMDVSVFQISRHWHPDALRAMPAVIAGTWGTDARGHSPLEGGYVPRYEEALRFTVSELQESRAYMLDEVDERLLRADQLLVRLMVASHNAGRGDKRSGALGGYLLHDDPDAFTANGDYSRWVLAARHEVNVWLAAHPAWRA